MSSVGLDSIGSLYGKSSVHLIDSQGIHVYEFIHARIVTHMIRTTSDLIVRVVLVVKIKVFMVMESQFRSWLVS